MEPPSASASAASSEGGSRWEEPSTTSEIEALSDREVPSSAHPEDDEHDREDDSRIEIPAAFSWDNILDRPGDSGSALPMVALSQRQRNELLLGNVERISSAAHSEQTEQLGDEIRAEGVGFFGRDWLSETLSETASEFSQSGSSMTFSTTLSKTKPWKTNTSMVSPVFSPRPRTPPPVPPPPQQPAVRARRASVVSRRASVIEPPANPIDTNLASETNLLKICCLPGLKPEAADRCEYLLEEDKTRAYWRDERGRTPLHLLCGAAGHNKSTVDICTAILKASKSAVKQTIGGLEHGGVLPIHVLCSNAHLTPYSDSVLRLLLKEHEEGAEAKGGAELELAVTMLCGLEMSGPGYRMFKRLVETNKDALKDKDKLGRTLTHRLCTSTARAPHTEFSVDALRLALELYKRAPELPDNKGLRPLHALCDSEKLTAHSVIMCKMLMDKAETITTVADDQGMLAVHHICGREGLTEHSLEVLRKLLEVFEKGAQAKDLQGRVGLHHVCSSGVLTKVSVDMTRQLLLAHKQGFSVADKQGKLPLHHLLGSTTANRKGMEWGEMMFDQLLWTDKSAVETPDINGRLPLHALAACGCYSPIELSILDKLIAFNYETCCMEDTARDLPFHLLCQSQPHTDFTWQAFDRLAAVMKREHQVSASEVAGAGGRLAIHSLCRSGGHTEHSVRMFEWLEQDNEHGLWFADGAGMTPIHWLCSALGHTEHSETIFVKLMDAIGKKDLDVSEMRTKEGLLPLHIICGAGKHTPFSTKIFDELVEAGPASVRARTMLSFLGMNSVMARRLSEEGAGPEGGKATNDDAGAEAAGPVEGTGALGAVLSAQPEEDEAEQEDHAQMLPFGRLPLHFLCGSHDHTWETVLICRRLVEAFREGVRAEDDEEQEPLHLLCQSNDLTEHSVEICGLLVEQYEQLLLDEEESDLRPLLYICQSHSLSENSVHMCRLLLESKARQDSRRETPGTPRPAQHHPLHQLCSTQPHTDHSVAICQQLLSEFKEWAKTRGEDGQVPLHVLAACKSHTKFSLEMCALLLEAFPSGIGCRSEADGFLPLHFLCENDTLTPFSTQISARLLDGRGATSARLKCKVGLTPLHHLCSTPLRSSSQVVLARQLLEKCPQAALMEGEAIFSHTEGKIIKEKDVDLPLHRLCQAQPHSEHSVQVCRYLVTVYEEAISTPGRQLIDEHMAMEEDILGDVPLMMLVKGDKLTPSSAEIAKMLVSDDDSLLTDVLTKLSVKVYRPKGDEIQQRMALRIMVCLAFLHMGKAMNFIQLDESLNGAHSISFFKEIVDELAFDAENPLHHVLRAGQLYSVLGENQTSSVVRLRLMKMSDIHVQWAVDIVEQLSGKVAKRALWSPEKHSPEFLMGDSPIAIALELGDLKIVSHGAVFDVVKDSWGGDYAFQYNPLSGSIYNNMFFEFAVTTIAGKANRSFKWTWEARIDETMSPLAFMTSPMMMYWLGIFLQTTYLIDFHVVVEYSSQSNDYPWSLGPASWYLALHLLGGVLYEVGQMAGDGLVRYSADPWNVVDISMYGLLAAWLFVRVQDANKAVAEGVDEFIPETSLSAEFLGLAAICIWLRMLNVFGLDPNFGPLVRTIEGMVSNVVVFLVLLVIFLFGFATSLKAIFKRFDLDSPDLEDSEFPFESFQTQDLAMLSLLDMALGQFELIAVFEVSQLAFWVTFFFLAATFIMLFNLLIALMSDTYSDIRQTSEQLWKKDRAQLMGAYTKTEKMTEYLNIGGILTALPPPMNLLVLVNTLLAIVPYMRHKMKHNESGKGWQKLVNQLIQVVMEVVLSILVCTPLSLFFVLVLLPINWIFVTSGGLIEYLGLTEKFKLLAAVPDNIRTLLSQLVGIAAFPFLFVFALGYGPWYFAKREIGRVVEMWMAEDDDGEKAVPDTSALNRGGLKPLDQQPHGAPNGIGHGNGAPNGFGHGNGVAVQGGQGAMQQMHAAQGGQGAANEAEEKPKEAVKKVKPDKVWEQDLDEDDKAALQEALLDTMPVDPSGEEDEPELAPMSEEDAALQEVRAELSKKMGTLDTNQRTLLQTTRDLQIESKEAQQATATTITRLEAKVRELAKESDYQARVTEHKMGRLQLETESKIQRVAKMMYMQVNMQKQAFKMQDQKANLLLQALGWEVDEETPTAFERTSFEDMWASTYIPLPDDVPVAHETADNQISRAPSAGTEGQEAQRASSSGQDAAGVPTADSAGAATTVPGQRTGEGPHGSGGAGATPDGQDVAGAQQPTTGGGGEGGGGEGGEGGGGGGGGGGVQGGGGGASGDTNSAPGSSSVSGGARRSSMSEPTRVREEGGTQHAEAPSSQPHAEAGVSSQGQSVPPGDQKSAPAAGQSGGGSAQQAARTDGAPEVSGDAGRGSVSAAEGVGAPGAAGQASSELARAPSQGGAAVAAGVEAGSVAGSRQESRAGSRRQSHAGSRRESHAGVTEKVVGGIKMRHRAQEPSSAPAVEINPFQKLESHISSEIQETKSELARVTEQMAAMMPVLDLLAKVIQEQDQHKTMIQHLQQRMSDIEPALTHLDDRLGKAERQAAANNDQLKGSVAALEQKLYVQQTENSTAILTAVNEKIADAVARTEEGQREVLEALGVGSETSQSVTAQTAAELQKQLEEGQHGQEEHVKAQSNTLMREINAKVETVVGQSTMEVEEKVEAAKEEMQRRVTQVAAEIRQELSGQVERLDDSLAAQGRELRQHISRLDEDVGRQHQDVTRQMTKLDARVIEQKEEVAQQITRLDDVVVEELTRLDARVRGETGEVARKSETQVALLMETLEARIADTLEELKVHQKQQADSVLTAISRIPPPPPPPPPDEEPRFTWPEIAPEDDGRGGSPARRRR